MTLQCPGCRPELIRYGFTGLAGGQGTGRPGAHPSRRWGCSSKSSGSTIPRRPQLTTLCQETSTREHSSTLRAEKINCKPAPFTPYRIGNKLGNAPGMQMRSIMSMSTAASFAAVVATAHNGLLEALANLRLHLRARFYRFLHELPERYDAVDPEVLKRVPVPI
jgi:hypothetical protein